MDAFEGEMQYLRWPATTGAITQTTCSSPPPPPLVLFSQPLPSHQTHFILRPLVLLAVLPLSLAIFAFVLQWRGGLEDRIFRRHENTRHFAGFGGSKVPSRTLASDCTEALCQSNAPAFPHLRGWWFNSHHVDDLKPKICITSSTSAGLEQILPWLYFHKVVGVDTFILFVEGKAASPNASSVLEAIAGVKVVHRTKELEEKQAKSRIWTDSWLTSFLYKPCNYELFVKQSLNMEMAIVMARDLGVDWIFHLDTDELLHPAGAREYSIRNLLSDVPSDVDTVVFVNYESSVERDNIKDPFGEVSMFKKNFDHLSRDAYFSIYKEAIRGNSNYFLTYGNGKSAARIQDHLRPNGAHRWANYLKILKEMRMPEAAVLHYSYTKFSDLTSRRDRCNCKPTEEDVKRCFMLPFDRDAFIIASTVTEEEMLHWYREHVVWDDEKLKLKLLKKGVFTRIHTPMVIIRALKESGLFSSSISSAKTFSKENS